MNHDIDILSFLERYSEDPETIKDMVEESLEPSVVREMLFMVADKVIGIADKEAEELDEVTNHGMKGVALFGIARAAYSTHADQLNIRPFVSLTALHAGNRMLADALESFNKAEVLLAEFVHKHKMNEGK